MRLAFAEAARLLTRRLTLVLVLVLGGAFAVTLATAAASTHEPGPAEVAAAERQAAAERDRRQDQYAECLEHRWPEAGVDCEQIHPDRVQVATYLPDVFVFSRAAEPLVYLLSALLALLGFLVGASFVGAELTSGGMINLLLWRPERLTVFAVKLAVLLGGVLALGVVATAVYLSSFWTLAQVAGLPGDLTARFWADLAWVSVRGLVLALAAAAVGFAAAVLGRRTSAAVGALVAYAVVWEVGGRIVLDVNRALQDHETWFVSSHLAAWVSGKLTVRFWPDQVVITWQQSAVVLGVLVVAAVGAAAADFRRRDLT